MTKTLEQIQKENRKFILEAIYGCSYEEALQKEEGHNCLYIYSTPYGNLKLVGDAKYYGYNRKKHHPDAFVKEIIGKPITLNRVLKAIDPFGNYGCIAGHICKVNRKQAKYAFVCEWNLEIETLEEQSEETQRVINQILTEYLIDNIKQ